MGHFWSVAKVALKFGCAKQSKNLKKVCINHVPNTKQGRHTVGQIPQKCKETSNLMWLSLIWFILVLFVCWNLFCTIANIRIKCVTETKKISLLFYKNLKSSFFTWLTHLTMRFLYIIGCSGPRCDACLLAKWGTMGWKNRWSYIRFFYDSV